MTWRKIQTIASVVGCDDNLPMVPLVSVTTINSGNYSHLEKLVTSCYVSGAISEDKSPQQRHRQEEEPKRNSKPFPLYPKLKDKALTKGPP